MLRGANIQQVNVLEMARNGYAHVYGANIYLV